MLHTYKVLLHIVEQATIVVLHFACKKTVVEMMYHEKERYIQLLTKLQEIFGCQWTTNSTHNREEKRG